MAGTFEAPEVVQEELDILLIGGGMACCGTAYEMMRWAEAELALVLAVASPGPQA